ncbi:hypothetical protein DID73_00090 [Candidatus Marinamargulisbacteria bacterium SCGC AG-343-K17]|nr:hypothetical protein DID73_00090 [Candidatus Marinamargulisbacteria bacterium SCGC AG-343-K17]
MKRYILILLLFISPAFAEVAQMGAVNIQTSMTSADLASFGRITPYETQSVGNLMVNPASIGGISFNQLTISNLQLSAQFDYRHFSFVIPYGGLIYGISYGTNVTAGFIETESQNGVIYDIGAFSSGFDVLHLSMGQQVNERFFFIDHFNYGFGLSMLTQVIGTSRRSPGYGLDVGVIATSFFDGFWLDRVDVGFSVINAVSTGLPSWTYDSTVGQSKAQLIERQIYTGAKFDLFNYTTGVHTGIYTQGFSLRDLMLGFDFQVAHGLNLRMSTTYDMLQGQEFVYNFGTGIMLNRVAGFGSSVYDMSVDYNYAMYPFPRANDPSHTISMTFLGQSTDRRPIVLSPLASYETDKPVASFSGTSDRNAFIYVYNGESLVGQVLANNNGKWEVDELYLDVGYNAITFRSKSGTNDLSKPSTPIVVHFDQTPPQISTELNIMADQISIQLTSNEELKVASMVSGNQTINFRRMSDKLYTLVVPLPNEMKSGNPLPEKMLTYDIVATDRIGNQTPTESISFFVEPLFPADQAVVYNDAITVLGYASPYVDSIAVNGNQIETDKNNGFSKSVQLNYGKQLVELNVKTKNGQRLNYFARLLCMKRYPDIPKFAKYRRDIEFLSTLGFVSGKDDGLFHPEEEMTRRDVTLAIAKQKKIEPKTLDYDPFLDIPLSDPDAGIISAAVDAGITYAFADGTFKPNEKVSIADAFKMLNNSGVIDSEDLVVSKKPIKRYEFALFFKQVRRYDQRVIYLMDWEQGYNLPN